MFSAVGVGLVEYGCIVGSCKDILLCVCLRQHLRLVSSHSLLQGWCRGLLHASGALVPWATWCLLPSCCCIKEYCACWVVSWSSLEPWRAGEVLQRFNKGQQPCCCLQSVTSSQSLDVRPRFSTWAMHKDTWAVATNIFTLQDLYGVARRSGNCSICLQLLPFLFDIS